MNKFAQLAADITKLWTKYHTAYLSGIENTLILALVGTVIGCLIGFICGILNTIPRRPNDHPLKKLILKACAYDPKDRFHSASEFREELEQLQRHGSLAKAGDGGEHAAPRAEAAQPLDDPAEGRFMHKQPDPAARRKKTGYIALAIALVLFLIGGIVDAIIPDKITAIEGVGASEEIYIGEHLAPDYTIEPD